MSQVHGLCGTAKAGEETENANEVNTSEKLALGRPGDEPKGDVVKHQTTKDNNEKKNKQVDTDDARKALFQSFGC